MTLFVGLCVSRIMQYTTEKMGLCCPTYIPLNFESDTDHHLDTKKIKHQEFPINLSLSHFAVVEKRDGFYKLYLPWWRSAFSECSCFYLTFGS